MALKLPKLPKLPPWLMSPWVLGGAAGAVVLAVLANQSSQPGGGVPGPGDPYDPAPGVPLAGPSDRVLLVGDSLAVGLNGPMKKLAVAQGNPYQGKGVSGSRIDEWSKKYLDPELAFDPTVVLVSLGTNDMKMADPVGQQTKHVQAILDKARAKGARVVWILPPPMPFDDKGVRAMVVGAAPDGAVNGEALDLERAGDGIHMTPNGYAAFADAVWSCIMQGQCPPPGVS